jgi:hypothetical protein
LCKFSYKSKVSKHDWCPEGAGLVEPDERWKYYMAHGTSHGSGRAGKGKQGGQKEEDSTSEDSDPSSSPSSDPSSDEEDKWCCNRRFRIEGKGRDWYRCNTVNDKSEIECQRCSMPRYDYDNAFEGPDPRLTAGRPDDNSGQQIPPTVRADHFIDGAAKCSGDEEEWDSQDVGTPVDQVEDETDVALLPLIPLPDDHHLHPWMRPNLVRKAELALSVAEATRLAQLKSRDEVRQSAMKVLIAQTKEYQDLALSPMHESMRKAVNIYINRIRAFAGIGSECGLGASPTPDLRDSARDVPRMRKYRIESER